MDYGAEIDRVYSKISNIEKIANVGFSLFYSTFFPSGLVYFVHPKIGAGMLSLSFTSFALSVPLASSLSRSYKKLAALEEMRGLESLYME